MPDSKLPTVHPDLARHQAAMKAEIIPLRGHIYQAFGFSVVNCTLIEGDESCILVDTMTGMENAEVVAEEFKKITDKPIKTVIYTHFHADHISGTKAFVSEEDVAAGAPCINLACDSLSAMKERWALAWARHSDRVLALSYHRRKYSNRFSQARQEESDTRFI